jgi:hypothetical protein
MTQTHRARSLGTTISAFLLAFGVLAAPAAAQTPGVVVGASADPDQFYFGGHLQTAPLLERLYFRPNAEIGIGDDVTVVALNFEFIYGFDSDYPWHVYTGAGPALNIVNFRDETDAQGGFNIVIGAAHREGLFVEMKVGALDSPELKFGVGYTFR